MKSATSDEETDDRTPLGTRTCWVLEPAEYQNLLSTRTCWATCNVPEVGKGKPNFSGLLVAHRVALA